MYIKSKTRYLGIVLAGLILTILLISPAWGPDAMAGSKSSGRSKIEYTGEKPVHPGYPGFFDFVGSLDRLTGKEAVLGDTLYRVSLTAAYHTPRQQDVSRSRLRAGDFVGCLINAAGEIESIWLISRKMR